VVNVLPLSPFSSKTRKVNCYCVHTRCSTHTYHSPRQKFCHCRTACVKQFTGYYKTDHQLRTHTQPFNGLFSRTTWVSRYQKGKTNVDFTGARDSEWQWHQLGHMQVCTSLQTDNHASTPPLCCFTDQMPFLPPNQQCQSTEGTTSYGQFRQNTFIQGLEITAHCDSWLLCATNTPTYLHTHASTHW